MRKSYITVAVVLSAFLIVALMILVTESGGKNFVAGILTGIPIFVFGRVMPAKTRTGAMAYMDSLGVQEFMNRAERDRLERMGDKNLFFKFLPYAVALDVTDNWAKAFEGIHQEPPDRYVSAGGFRSFTRFAFTHSFNAVTSSLGSAMFSAPIFLNHSSNCRCIQV